MDTIVDPKRPTGKRRRRTYTEAQRLQILDEAARPGTSVAAVARRHGINDNVIFNWRKQRQGSRARMLPVTVTAEPVADACENRPVKSLRPCAANSGIEIRTPAGHVIQIGAGADAQMVQLVLATLRA